MNIHLNEMYKGDIMLLFLILTYFIIVILSYFIFKDNCRYLRNKNYIRFIAIMRILGLLALFIRFFYYYLWSASLLGDLLLFVATFYMINTTLAFIFLILRKLFHHQKRFHGSESIIIIFIVSLVLCGFGIQQAVDFQEKDYTIYTSKPIQSKLALISDLHLGNSLRKKSMKRMLTMIAKSDAQALFITGDLFDESTAIKDMNNFIENIKMFSIPVYYIQGNHESLSVYEGQFYQQLKDAGVICLFDESVLVNDTYYVIGRKDQRQGSRKSLKQLMQGLDQSKFLLVLDHQPNVDVSKKIDLQLSGHTHNGQIFPANLITKLRYSNLYGYYDKDYPMVVTSGIGTWGFPMRMGSQSEIVYLQVESK